MDELDLFKKQWQEREQDLPKLSYADIYKLLLKKSSSIVKWIFYISIGELVFWTILSLFVPESSRKINDQLGLHEIFTVINIINYLVIAFFIYLFYKNYRRIQTTDTTKELMQNILKTRKTVKYFVIYNVGSFILLFTLINVFYYLHSGILFDLIRKSEETYETIPEDDFKTYFFIGQLIFGALFLIFILIFYRIIYGILLKRLNKNYKELKKIEL